MIKGEGPCCPKCGRTMLITCSMASPYGENRIIHSGHCPVHINMKMDIFIKDEGSGLDE